MQNFVDKFKSIDTLIQYALPLNNVNENIKNYFSKYIGFYKASIICLENLNCITINAYNDDSYYYQ